MNETKPPTADDLKRLAEAYPWIEEISATFGEPGWIRNPGIARDDVKRMLDLAAQLLASNRAKDERIEKLRAALRGCDDISDCENVWLPAQDALAADDAAQRKAPQ